MAVGAIGRATMIHVAWVFVVAQMMLHSMPMKAEEGAGRLLALVLRRLADVPEEHFRGWRLSCGEPGHTTGISLTSLVSPLERPVVISGVRSEEGEILVECFVAPREVLQISMNGIPAPNSHATRAAMIDLEVDEVRQLGGESQLTPASAVRILVRWNNERAVVSLEDYREWLTDFSINGAFGTVFAPADSEARALGAKILLDIR